MYVVVVGSRDRRTEQDRQYVYVVLETLKAKYRGSLVVLSASCEVGIGLFVKERCRRENLEFQFIELSQRIYADVPKSRIRRFFNARNAMLAEVGDEFHIFLYPLRKDGFEQDLVRRLAATETMMPRPVRLYLPGEDPTTFVDTVGQQTKDGL